MRNHIKTYSRVAGPVSLLAAVLVIFSAPAIGQQSLALSYKLDVRGEGVEQPASQLNRCTGFSWVASIGACGRELLARLALVTERIAHGVPAESDGAVAAVPATGSSPVGDAPSRRAEAAPELPMLGGAAAETRYLRSAGGRDALIGSSRTADLLLRFGSKHRFRSNDEGGWDWYRFNDTAYQNHLENKGHKAVGVELLVPFQ